VSIIVSVPVQAETEVYSGSWLDMRSRERTCFIIYLAYQATTCQMFAVYTLPVYCVTSCALRCWHQPITTLGGPVTSRSLPGAPFPSDNLQTASKVRWVEAKTNKVRLAACAHCLYENKIITSVVNFFEGIYSFLFAECNQKFQNGVLV